MLHLNPRLKALPAAALALTLLVAGTCGAAPAPQPTWDHLVKVKAKQFDAVYLLPGADFRGYTKILIDPIQVAFKKNWQRDINSASVDPSRRISNDEAARIAERTRSGTLKIYSEAFTAAGYEIVTEAGPDVLRVAPNVIDLYITAPDPLVAGRSRSYSVDAGEATLALEVRDSTTGEILGRVVDRERAGGTGMRLSRATDVSNNADFDRLYRRWAELSVKALAALKAKSPLPPAQPKAPAPASTTPG